MNRGLSVASRRIRFWPLVLVILLFLGMCIFVPYGGIAFELLFGWRMYLARVLARVNFRLDGLAVFLVGLAIATSCFHVVVSWLVGEMAARRRRSVGSSQQVDENSGAPGEVRWRFRSSLAAVLMILGLFVVGIAMTGVVHQTIWLLNSPVPLFVDSVQTPEDAKLSLYDPGKTAVHKSWIGLVFPFLGAELPEFHDRELPFNAPVNRESFEKAFLPEALCPSQYYPVFSRDGFGLSHIAADPRILGRKLDHGSRMAFMFGEVNAAFEPWANPGNTRSPELGVRRSWSDSGRGRVGFGSLHNGGINFARMDGTVESIGFNASPQVLEQLSAPPPDSGEFD